MTFTVSLTISLTVTFTMSFTIEMNLSKCKNDTRTLKEMDNLQYVGSGNSGYWELNEGDDNI